MISRNDISVNRHRIQRLLGINIKADFNFLMPRHRLIALGTGYYRRFTAARFAEALTEVDLYRQNIAFSGHFNILHPASLPFLFRFCFRKLVYHIRLFLARHPACWGKSLQNCVAFGSTSDIIIVGIFCNLFVCSHRYRYM